MVAEARERMQSLSVEEVASEIEGGNALIVDLREDDERFLVGTIPGSLHVPRGDDSDLGGSHESPPI